MSAAEALRPLLRPGIRLLAQQHPYRPIGLSRARAAAAAAVVVPAARPASQCLSCSTVRACIRSYSTSPPAPPGGGKPPPPPSSREDELSSILSSVSKPPKSTTIPDDPTTTQPGTSPESSPFSPSTTAPTTDSSSKPTAPDGHSSSSSPTASPSSSSPPAAADLPSAAESRRAPLSARFSTLMDNLQSRVFVASQALNDLTGYSAIEAIKQRNNDLERALAHAQSRLRAARRAYQDVNERRASTQREVTTLLARKDAWSPADLERFTSLYRLDHELEAGVARAGADLTEAEADESRLGAELNAGILKRYHEEQVWSDRIRRQSTWGTWGLMGVNVLLFIVLQFFAEPWKRRRLMRGMAEREQAVLDEVRRELGEVKGALEASAAATTAAAAVHTQAQPLAETKKADPAAAAGKPSAQATDQAASSPWPDKTVGGALSWREFLTDAARWKPAVGDLFSERLVALKMRDASLLALEGAVAGATMAAGVAFLLLRRT
ncbi:uncharacterized protein E0L32_000446 [Thyridium curvatum]|uniref:Sensitive to high expression protein 9, mitochondrial n=1 Tax=Thyridium curvatum TaxID=1093900 RepID=A0A507AVQ2_9PEZI|nr:uncharacterized protein E0L32_000446 [Thyridium curvatum]TPX14052.1 hypothetical protein E0L32_000446 [Thyridium curvatum]